MKVIQACFKSLLVLGLSALLAPQAMACYTVYNPANQVIYHAMEAPIDMSYQIHERLPRVFPTGHMIFSIVETDCPIVNVTRAPLSSVAMLTNVSGARGRKRDRQ